MSASRQFSLAYALIEVALCATALAAGRLALANGVVGEEVQALCVCIAATAVCGAVGGLCLRMALGLLAGGILSVAAIPSLCLLLR